jgi:hypothetical protein
MNRRAFLAATGRATLAASFASIGACVTRDHRDRRVADWDGAGHPFAFCISRLIPELMTEARVPGCSMALIKNGRPFWRQGFGVKSVATGEAVGNEAVFEAASISKTVFSFADGCADRRGNLLGFGLGGPGTSNGKCDRSLGWPGGFSVFDDGVHVPQSGLHPFHKQRQWLEAFPSPEVREIDERTSGR